MNNIINLADSSDDEEYKEHDNKRIRLNDDDEYEKYELDNSDNNKDDDLENYEILLL